MHKNIAPSKKGNRPMMIVWNNNKEKLDFDAFYHIVNYVIENQPETWKTYTKSMLGAKSIVEMEYAELMKEAKKSDTFVRDKQKECIHVAAACYQLWKCLADEQHD